ncbi:MAG: KH domain-containing protein [Oscillospiraceae bacterium]
MTNLIIAMVSDLVEKKDEISIEESSINEEGVIVYTVKVAETDTGRVIGKQGKTAKAIRTIVRASAAKKGIKVAVEII